MRSEIARARFSLAAGAALGIALAARGVLRPARAASVVPDGAVALVGDTPIPEAEYARAVAAVESERRDHHADAALRRHVLDRLVEEQLLVQRALELGLPTREPRLRGQIAATMIDGVLGGPAAPTPPEAELRAFHAARAELFTRRGRVELETLFFRGEPASASARARVALQRIDAGEPFAAVASTADAPAAQVPRGPLPVSKLADYVGPVVMRAVEGLPPGATSAVVAVDGGVWIARVVSRERGELAPFDEARADVLAEWRREQDDLRLRRWLEERRAATRVVLKDPSP